MLASHARLQVACPSSFCLWRVLQNSLDDLSSGVRLIILEQGPACLRDYTIQGLSASTEILACSLQSFTNIPRTVEEIEFVMAGGPWPPADAGPSSPAAKKQKA